MFVTWHFLIFFWNCCVVANVFVHRESLESVAMESGLEDELSDSDDTERQQKIIYKIGTSLKLTICHSGGGELAACCPLVSHFEYIDCPTVSSCLGIRGYRPI